VVVREGLRLDPLGRVHQQDGSLAGLERPRHLIGEVDVAGRVDQVQDVGGAVALVGQADGLGLDGDPPLALQVHPVEVLLAHLPVRDGVREVQDAVGQRGLPVVDVRHDAEVPQELGVELVGGHGALIVRG
jgi:hypothetical protein